MPYYKDINLLFIHIPKTGGTSLENYLQTKSSQSLYSDVTNNIMPELRLQQISLQHQFFKDIWRYRKHIGVNFDNIRIISIVRNPYDRIVSDLLYFNLIEKTTSLEKVYKTIQNYLTRTDLDNHNVPQYRFICDSKENLKVNMNQIKIFRTESLTKDLHEYGFTDYKGKDSSNSYMKYLNKDSISLINNFYKIDFIVFDYTMV